MQMLEVLRDGPATLSQIAARLKVHPANLTRHARTLEKAKLIRLVEKRDTGRNLEKYYAAAADTFDVAPEADQLRAPHKTGLALLRSDLSAALRHLPDCKPGAVKVLLIEARIDAAFITDFVARLSRLAERFGSQDSASGSTYHLGLALYPYGSSRARPARANLSARRGK
jgi:DNA-binding transcriptional ArsR family regulator